LAKKCKRDSFASMNRLPNRQSGNDMLHADSRAAIPIFAARGFSRGSYAGSKGIKDDVGATLKGANIRVCAGLSAPSPRKRGEGRLPGCRLT